MDNLLVTGIKQSAIDDFYMEIKVLSIKDLRIASKYLGLRITLDDSEGYTLDQKVSINLLLKEFGLESTNGVCSPIGD